MEGFFQRRWYWQSHHVDTLFQQLDSLTRRGQAANAARLSVSIVHGAGLAGESATHVFGVGNHMTQRF